MINLEILKHINQNSTLYVKQKNRCGGRKALLTLYTLLIVCMGFATIIEKYLGSQFVSDAIYGSWWFIGLWAVLTLMAFLFMARHRLHKRIVVFMLHVSFAVILAGALTTHIAALHGKVHLRTEVDVKAFLDDDNEVHSLPFTLRLTDFHVVNYPGTDGIMDYRCSINVNDGQTQRKIDVSMNNIGRVDGYRFYQSAYDEDGRGSVLLVSYDPYGIALTYIGYIMLVISFILLFFTRDTRIRHLYRMATGRSALIFFMLLFATGVSAVNTVPKETAHELGKVAVLYNGRICPLNTASSDFLTKLSGKSTWNGYTADEVMVSWMVYYTEWEHQPLIRVKNKSVQQMIGIDDQWASVTDFYTASHEYKLAGKSNDTSIPDAVRKAIRETDEKIQVVMMFYNNEMLRIFPLATPDSHGIATAEGKALSWYAPGSTELPLGTPEREFQFINHAMDRLVTCILANDTKGARVIIDKIRLYQREKAGDVMPSAVAMRLEIISNTLQSARYIVFIALTLSIVFCFLALSGRRNRVLVFANGIYIALQTLLLTFMLAARWIVSGHVPMSNGFETMLFMAWVVIIIALVAYRRASILTPFATVVSSLCMLVAMIASGNPQVTPLMPVLQSPLLTVHVALVMIAYSLFALITLIAAYSLYINRFGTSHQPREGKGSASLSALAALMLYPAVACLAVGIFIGAVWANISWGTYWSWDPKETWALITLMIYALPLHRTLMPSSSNDSEFTFHDLYLVLAFVAVIVTYFGVNYFLPGMHSYA